MDLALPQEPRAVADERLEALMSRLEEGIQDTDSGLQLLPDDAPSLIRAYVAQQVAQLPASPAPQEPRASLVTDCEEVDDDRCGECAKCREQMWLHELEKRRELEAKLAQLTAAPSVLPPPAQPRHDDVTAADHE